ncbi:MAG: hypothetical protein LBN93_00510 [Candidatus Symbiothrix sp.]|nr:hypothetical protein [Candidatus Symbiothrix sp.]
MKTLKVMSIIGLVWFALLFIVMVSEECTVDEALGMGLCAILYAIPYSIVGLVQSSKKEDK